MTKPFSRSGFPCQIAALPSWPIWVIFSLQFLFAGVFLLLSFFLAESDPGLGFLDLFGFYGFWLPYVFTFWRDFFSFDFFWVFSSGIGFYMLCLALCFWFFDFGGTSLLLPSGFSLLPAMMCAPVPLFCEVWLGYLLLFLQDFFLAELVMKLGFWSCFSFLRLFPSVLSFALLGFLRLCLSSCFSFRLLFILACSWFLFFFCFFWRDFFCFPPNTFFFPQACPGVFFFLTLSFCTLTLP